MTRVWRQLTATGGGLLVARDATLAAVCAAFGFWPSTAGGSHATIAVVAIVVALSAAVGLFRRSPATALALVWLAGVTQILSRSDVLAVQAGVLVVAYGVARHGRVLTVWLGGFSVPIGAGLAGYYVFGSGARLPSAIDVATPLLRLTGVGIASTFVLGTAILGTPWMLGLLIRLNARYQRSANQRELARMRASAAEQTAELRTQQAQLARDVHDMVGHSLAVIIAQADAAQTVAGGADRSVQQALGNIAAVARSSLGEVREVLSRTQDRGAATPMPDAAMPMPMPMPDADPSALVARVREAGNDVHDRVHGTPSELAPQMRTALYRVLQEMLTNAIKHGRPGGRIDIEQTWEPTEYTVSVSNTASSGAGSSVGSDRMGLSGMRVRLRDLGGTLDVTEPDSEGDPPLFTARARVPLHVDQARP